MTVDWSAATYEGARRAAAADAARATPAQRLAALEGLLVMALESGALARERAARQAALDELWGG